MAEGPIHRKTIQQNLVNYISHNLGRKTDKEMEMEKEKSDCKSSSAKGIKMDRTSTNSVSHPNRPKAGAQGQSTPSSQSATTKPMPRGQTPSEQKLHSDQEQYPKQLYTSKKSHTAQLGKGK